MADDFSLDDDGTLVRRPLKIDIDDGDVAWLIFPARSSPRVDVRSLHAIARREKERLGLPTA